MHCQPHLQRRYSGRQPHCCTRTCPSPAQVVLPWGTASSLSTQKDCCASPDSSSQPPKPPQHSQRGVVSCQVPPSPISIPLSPPSRAVCSLLTSFPTSARVTTCASSTDRPTRPTLQGQLASLSGLPELPSMPMSVKDWNDYRADELQDHKLLDDAAKRRIMRVCLPCPALAGSWP